MSEDHEHWLLEMLERPDRAYTNPGRKDNVYIEKIDGERCYVQKRYLLWNLRDASEILNGQKESFKEKFGEPLTFTKFYQFIKKKKQFIFQQDILDTLCLCEICENATLVAKAIRKEKKGHPATPHDLCDKYSCDSSNANCISKRCRECSPTKILSGWNEASRKQYRRIIKGGKMKKITKHETL